VHFSVERGEKISTKNMALILALLFIFIAGVSSSYATDVDTTNLTKNETIDVKPTKLAQSDILEASKSLDQYVTKKGKLPRYLKIDGYKFSMPEVMYIFSKTVEYKYKGVDSKVTIKYDVKNPTGPSGTNIKGKISSEDIFDYTTRVANYIIEYDTAPNYVNTPLGQIQYQQTIYSFVKVLNATEKNGNAPASISFNFKSNDKINSYVPKYVRPGSTVDSDEADVSASKLNLSGTEGLLKLQKYMNKNFNHASGASHTAAGVEKTGYGDCWGLADWAAKTLKANGYENVRIVQGATSSASNHRWVQVKIDGKWINFESSLVTKRYGSKHYTTTCARVSTIVKYL